MSQSRNTINKEISRFRFQSGKNNNNNNSSPKNDSHLGLKLKKNSILREFSENFDGNSSKINKIERIRYKKRYYLIKFSFRKLNLCI